MRLGFEMCGSKGAGVRTARSGAKALASVLALASAAVLAALAEPDRALAVSLDAGASSAGGGAHAPAGGTGQQAELDAVVQEVVRMLQAKVSEPVIVHWLDTSGRRPEAIGSREIVELKRAGASDPLTTRLLDLSASKSAPGEGPAASAPPKPVPTAPAPGARAPGQPAATVPSSAVAAPSQEGAAAAPAARAEAPASAAGPASAASTPAPAGSTPVAAETAARGAPGQAANVHWRIAYHPNFGPDDERWDLYVYLDGRYLARVKAPVVSLLDPPLEFDRALAAGHHVLRVMEERHLHNFGRSGWSHAARVAPAVLAFDLAPAAAGRVELRCETGQRGGPLRLRVTQGDAEVAKATPAAPEPDAWPPLCEEAAAGRSAGRRASGSAGREPASCLRWTDLWPGVPAAPSRDAVRAELERHDFHPDPARAGD
jgi:hypothetical protein